MSFLLGIIPVVLGVGIVAKYVGKLKKLLSEVAELLVKVTTVLDDNAVSNDEIAAIIQDAKDVVDAVKAFAQK